MEFQSIKDISDEGLVKLLTDPSNWNDEVLTETERRLNDNSLNESFAEFCAEILKDQRCIELRKAIDARLAVREPQEELEYTQNGKIKQSFSNVCIIMRNDFAQYLSYNVMDGRTMIRGVPWEVGQHPVRDNDINHIAEIISRDYGIDSEQKVLSAVNMTARSNMVHPVRDVLENLEWDGVPRLAELFPRYLGAERSEYTTAVTRILLGGAVARVYHPGIKFDLCVVLADTRQGTGKSTMCRLLALKDEWFADGLGDLSNTKTAYESIRGKWFVEMAEMISTRRTKDVESIKGFISRTSDFYREPYSKCSEDYPRRCVFIGTTNQPQFLPDDRTGNRRFLPLVCNGDRAVVHPMANENETRLYIMQCYAELIATSKGQYQLTLPREFDAEINAIRAESTPEDSRVGMIQSWLDSTDQNIVCVEMIWREVLQGDFEKRPTKTESKEIADIMSLCIKGWSRYAGKDGKAKSNHYRFPLPYGKQRAWQRDVPNGNSDGNSGVHSDGNSVDFDAYSEPEGYQDPVFD